ncbi:MULTISPECIES: hypothetical protein [Gordonia]|jgi:hypothetical protein|uniref:hypothetical protein n=1 Tax=Gordonia TaxID=2053 RepID=UPI0025BADA00|nr:hypothetical protein [Gordonia sp. UBA5067]
MGTRSDGRAARAIFVLGVGLFLAGIVAVGALFLVPAVWPGHTAPLPVYLLAMSTPAGFFLAVAATVATGRRRTRRPTPESQ